MSAIEDRERTILVDVSSARNSADAVRQLELYLTQFLSSTPPGVQVDINAGDLLLTPGILAKVKALIGSKGRQIKTLYSSVPQTQQTALNEGLLVKQFPPRNKQMAESFFMETTPFVKEPSSIWQDVDLPFASRAGQAPEEPVPVEEMLPPVESQVDLQRSQLSVTDEHGSRHQIMDAQRLSSLPTVYYKHNLRSGQVLESEGHVVIVGDAHSGSEIYADGDILVWGFLGGIAHAGRSGMMTAEIRAMRIEAVQLRIADLIARRPDRLFKSDYDPQRGPEVARVNNHEIQIFEDIVER